MKLSQRLTHKVIWIALAFVLPLLFYFALAATPQRAINPPSYLEETLTPPIQILAQDELAEISFRESTDTDSAKLQLLLFTSLPEPGILFRIEGDQDLSYVSRDGNYLYDLPGGWSPDSASFQLFNTMTDEVWHQFTSVK